jgi:hypothetical protein
MPPLPLANSLTSTPGEILVQFKERRLFQRRVEHPGHMKRKVE